MDIEVLATTAVKDSISWTDYLVPYIPEKDKEPIWDGFVHVYSSPVKSNENNMGRVPTQVKGKTVCEFKSSEYFDVPVCELKSYLHEGGVIFFVVELSESVEKKKIFYNSLLPYDLIKLIEVAGQQVSKRINLSPFPSKNEDKIDIFLNFLSTRKKQHPTSSIERIIPIEEFVKQGYPLNLSLNFTKSQSNKSILDYFIDNGMYLYFNTPLGLSFPVNHIVNAQMVTAKVEKPILCKGRKFYDYYKQTQTKSGCELSFGEAVHFFINNNKKSISLNVKLSGTLNERIFDCEFILDVFQEKGFYVGEHFLPADLNKFKGDMIKTWQDSLSFMKSVRNALDYMGVINDLDCDNLTDDDNKKIQYWLLPSAIGKSVRIDSFKEEYQLTTLSISNLNILVLAVKQSDKQYILKNFFIENGSFALQTEGGTMIPSSCYAVLEKNDFIRLSNLDYSCMVKNMKMELPHQLYCDKVNYIVLNLLAAYDDTSRLEILQTARELATWLCSNNESDVIFRLNLLQIFKRERVLNCTEIQWLQNLVTEQELQDECKMGAYILLEDYKNAAIYYNGLSQERKDKYATYPIMTLWKHEIS